MKNIDKNKNLLILIITPLIVLLICTAVLILCGINPYNKLSVYINLAFMDEFRTTPENEANGLVIKDGEILMEYDGETFDEGKITRPSYGEQFAVLRSSAMEQGVPVYWGSESKLFERGACQATYSKLPGDKGNTVISAHEDTFFSQLSNLKVGDEVTINTNYGEFIYKVSETISFKKTSKKYVMPTDEVKLTLYTCKKDILGSSDERIGVICEPVEQKFYLAAGEEAEK